MNDFVPDDPSERTPSRNTDPDTVSNQNLPVPGGSLQKTPDHTVDQKAAPESGSDWKSTAYATTKLAIDLVKETSDAFPPLKAVAAGLSAILDHCDVRSISLKAKRFTILTTVLENGRLSPNDRIFDAQS